MTDHPTAVWTARQILEAFPNETAPRYLLRDRDAIYGERFTRCLANMGIRDVIIAPRAPWQNAFAERVIGSIRRECLDHVIILSEAHLRRVLRAYLAYYNTARPHQSLANNSPQPRLVEPPAPWPDHRHASGRWAPSPLPARRLITATATLLCARSSTVASAAGSPCGPSHLRFAQMLPRSVDD